MTKRTDQSIREIGDLWAHGLPAKFICPAYGIHKATLNRWLTSSGRDFTGRRSVWNPKDLKDEYLSMARQMRSEGKTWQQVEDRLGFDKGNLQRVLSGKRRALRPEKVET